MTTFTDIENLLFVRLGFDVETIGRKAIEATLGRSMYEAGLSDPSEYAAVLERDPDAWNWLVDRVVIPETWFFRDIAPFDLAVELLRAHMRAAPGRVFRVLSCPCSTGEEPYSLVMAMLNAGASPESFSVEAVDVSLSSLDAARAAQFRARSFRNDILWYRTAYFDRLEDEDMWRLNPSVKSLVRFRQDNCVAPDFLQNEPPYDAVFCRNLLIYLHSDARRIVSRALHRLVTDNGVLVLGNSEAAVARDYGFVPTGPPAAFAFIKRAASAALKVPPGNRPTAKMSVPSRPLLAAKSVERSVPDVPVGKPALGAVDSERLLAAANRLGNAGQLEEALQACRDYLQRVPNSAEGYFLLGVLQDALGHSILAAGSFRKVLYLDPNHREALLHLALKREAAGDSSGAARLRARARRSPETDAAEQ